VAGCFELGNEPSGSIKGGDFLDSLIMKNTGKTVASGVGWLAS